MRVNKRLIPDFYLKFFLKKLYSLREFFQLLKKKTLLIIVNFFEGKFLLLWYNVNGTIFSQEDEMKKFLKTKIALTLLAGLVVSAIPTNSNVAKAEDKETDFTIVHFNDLHGHINATDKELGIAKIAGFINEQKKDDEVLVLNAGDLIQGTIYTTLTKGEAMIEPVNAMQLDAIAAGNHEFDYGLDQLLKIEKKLKAPIISANIKYKKDDSLLFKHSIIEEIDGIKVGVFGLTTPETSYKTSPKNVEDLYFDDIVKTSREMVKYLNDQGVDIVIGLAHVGNEGNDTTIKVAEQVEGIDVIIDGHSQIVFEEKVKDTLIVQAGEYGENIGKLKITKKDNGEITVKPFMYSYDEVKDVTPDAKVTKAVENVLTKVDKITNQVIATTEVRLAGEREEVRTRETNLGNMVADAMKNSFKDADVALTNGGGIRASIAKGDITKGNIIDVLPFGNVASLIEVTGQDIQTALEHGLSQYPEANGAFPHISGMKVEFDPSKPAGSRITKLTVGGAPIDLNKKYKLATNDFLAVGGDDYSTLKKTSIGEGNTLDALLMDFVKTKGSYKSAEGRIKPIK